MSEDRRRSGRLPSRSGEDLIRRQRLDENGKPAGRFHRVSDASFRTWRFRVHQPLEGELGEGLPWRGEANRIREEQYRRQGCFNNMCCLFYLLAFTLVTIVLVQAGVLGWFFGKETMTIGDKPVGTSVPVAVAPTPRPALAGDSPGFDISFDEGLYADQREEVVVDLNNALAYVSTRFGSWPTERFIVGVLVDGNCVLHGITYTDVRTMQVFTCDGISRDRAVAILAHEIVHQLEQDKYGAPHLRSDTILSEGLATWGAGRYWLGDAPDFRTYVRNQRRSGVSYPLATDYTGLGIDAMNAIYYQWGSFVEYLLSAYGQEKFDKVYVAGGSAIGSADYVSAYGKSLEELEHEWETWIGK